MSSDHVTPPRGDGSSPNGPDGDASLGDLFSRLSEDLSTLFRQEVDLAKTELKYEANALVKIAKAEMKQEATALGKASAMLVAAGVLGFVTLLLLAWAASWALAALMPTGLAFLIVGVVVGAVAGVLAMMGKKRLETVDLAPNETIERLQEDKQVMSERIVQ